MPTIYLSIYLVVYLLTCPLLPTLAFEQARNDLERAVAKRHRSDDPSASGGVSVEDLEARVSELEDTLRVLTEALGEGRTPAGKWIAQAEAKGLAARCALAALKARGKHPNPGHPSASGVAHPNCVHETRLGECLVREQLAYCYYCHQPLCPQHRVLVGEPTTKEQCNRIPANKLRLCENVV